MKSLGQSEDDGPPLGSYDRGDGPVDHPDHRGQRWHCVGSSSGCDLLGGKAPVSSGHGSSPQYPGKEIEAQLGQTKCELEHVPPRLNQGDSRGAKDGRVYRH